MTHIQIKKVGDITHPSVQWLVQEAHFLKFVLLLPKTIQILHAKGPVIQIQILYCLIYIKSISAMLKDL